jgi:hypothetical protein
MPAGLSQESQRLFARDHDGIMYVGDRGIIVAGFNGDSPRVYPESKKYEVPARESDDASPRDLAIDQFIAACKGGPPPLANFEIQQPVTEAFLLGCLAQRMPGERFEWDSAQMRVTNSEAANRWIDPAYREGFV